MTFFYDLNKKLASLAGVQQLTEGKAAKPDFLDVDKDGDRKEPMKKAAKEIDEAGYSAKAARAGKDIGKPGKAFAKIAKSAGEKYGSKERGEKVAGAVLKKLRAKESEEMDESYDELEVGQRRRTGSGEIERTKTGVIHRAKQRYGGDDDSDEGSDDDYDEWGNFKGKKKAEKSDGPKKKGRPAGSKRAIGAKGPTGKSKLMKKGAIKEEEYDLDEAIARLEAAGYTVEKAPPGAKAERMVKGIKKAFAKDGKLTDKEKAIAYATTWKAHKQGKVEEESSDSKPAKKSKSGIQFGKGVYEAMDERLEKVISEGMNVSVNMGVGADGQATKNINISADGDDAEKLAELLNLAGMSTKQVEEENQPDWPTDEVVTGDNDPHLRQYAGGLNGPKSTGQTVGAPFNRQDSRQGVMSEEKDLGLSLYKELKQFKGK